jgi:glycerate dehydrogenase
MRIVALDGYALNPGDLSWDALAELGNLTVYPRTSPAEFTARFGEAEIAVTNKVPFDAERIASLPHLKFIAVTATGYNVIDTAAARRHGVAVSNVPAYSTDSVAQHAFALILNLAGRIDEHARAVEKGDWTRSPDMNLMLHAPIELAGKTIGIIGFGAIGRRVAELAHALGMKVLGYSRSRKNAPSYQPFAWADLPEILAASDVISLHVPQTPETTGLIDRNTLGRMKPGALLINTARGGLVNERDLADALNTGRIAGAGLDVVAIEPMAAENPLRAAKNCIITPHIAWATLEARRRCMAITAANIAAFLKEQPINVVN